MKLLLQCVAALLVACLAVPPSLAEGLCVMLKGIHPAEMRCCSTMNQAMIRASAQEPACGDPCCLVSPRSSPVSTAPEKFQADSAPLTLPGWETVAPAPGAEPHSPSAKLDASVSARYILLMTFRI